MNSTFTVRRISYGEGVERVFPEHSPRVEKVEVERKGSVRRAKLTYLRQRIGKSATLVKEKEGRVAKAAPASCRGGAGGGAVHNSGPGHRRSGCRASLTPSPDPAPEAAAAPAVK